MNETKKPKSSQGSARHAPDIMDNEIALILHCLQCGTMRSYIISPHLNALEARRTAAFGIEAICQQCGRIIGATLAWTARTKGYSWRHPPPMDAYRIEDAIGLRKPEARNLNQLR